MEVVVLEGGHHLAVRQHRRAFATRVIYADPAQPYLPEALRRERAAVLPHGEVVVLEGGHHLHMEDPRARRAAIGDFLTAGGLTASS